MASFLQEMVLRITKGSKITKEDYDNNPTKIAEQIDKFKLLDTTTAPTGPNEPVGELGNVIATNTNLYRHNGTEWICFLGTPVPAPEFAFIDFSEADGGGSLDFVVENEGAANFGYYKVFSINTFSEIGNEISADGNINYNTSGANVTLIPGNSYLIRAYDANNQLIKTTIDDGLANVQAT